MENISRIKGYTFIELMVSLVLGLLLLSSLITVYLGSKNTYRLQEKLANMQEAGRYVSYFLIREISHAKHIQGYTNNNNDVINLDDDRLRFFIAKTSYGVSALYFKKINSKRREILADNVTTLKTKYGIKCQNKIAVCYYLPESKVKNWNDVIAVSLEITLLKHKWELYASLRR